MALNVRIAAMAAVLEAAMRAPVINAYPNVEVARPTPLKLATPRKKKPRGKLIRATGPQSYDEWKRQIAQERAQKREKLCVDEGCPQAGTPHECVAAATGQPLIAQAIAQLPKGNLLPAFNAAVRLEEKPSTLSDDIGSWF